MSFALSPRARRMADEQATDDYAVVLMDIRHRDVDFVIRLSSDPTEVISLDPYTLGTHSTWQNPDGEPFKFAAMAIDLPDDTVESLHQGSIAIDLLDSRLMELLTSTIVPARIDIAVVLRSSPNFVERQFRGLQTASAESDGSIASVTFSRKNLLDEPCPAWRMTKERCPGLHR